jgi:hypothetical protein
VQPVEPVAPALPVVLRSHEATLAAAPAAAPAIYRGRVPSGPADSLAARIRPAAGHSPGTTSIMQSATAMRLNGRVPVLAASSLARQNPGAFSITLDFEMIRRGAEPAVEIDRCAVGDRKVILCEARSSSTLAASDSGEKRDTAKLVTAGRADRRRPMTGHCPGRM